MKIFLILILGFMFSCKKGTNKIDGTVSIVQEIAEEKPKIDIPNYDFNTKAIHIIVALCDNKYQGIVPVPKNIGNGQDPMNNLYWGTAYGIKHILKEVQNGLY